MKHVDAWRTSGSVCLLSMLAASCAMASEPSRAQAKPNATAKSAVSVVAPDPEAITKSRLVTTSCQQLEREALVEQQRQLQEMRKALKKEFDDWQAQQPDCWRAHQPHGNMWGDEIGDAFGAGGLGLSGIGEGGGGRGEGIGLGSIGTLGHGAGTGSGQGFGTGHGRLGGAHASRSPSIRMGEASVGHSMSGTNTQVQDVDEADIVKSDGDYVYLVVNGALRIVTSEKPHLVSVTRLPGQVREMFVEGERAAVYVSYGTATKPRCTYGYDCQFTGDGTRTSLLIYNIKNREQPSLARRVDFSGSLLASRRVGSMVHTVVTSGDSRSQAYYSTWPDNMPTCDIYESAVKAQLKRLEENNERLIREATRLKIPSITENGVERKLCDAVYRTAADDAGAFTSIVSLDLHNDSVPSHAATIQSNPGAVFATAGNVYLAVTARPAGFARGDNHAVSAHAEQTNIHRFAVGTTPSATRYTGSGATPGHVLNQFSMDEWNGNLRIATTRGRVPDPNVDSSVSVLLPTLNGNLERVGSVDNIAPGEDIRSVRFEADRGYVVTFKKTDPLFVLDLKEPRAPKLLGELKIPGFSTYMHRIDDTHLLSIGYDANDHGDFAYFDGIILQLFDVTNPLSPKLLFKEKIGTRGSSSEAATNHLAFNYFAERGLLALPMTICEGGGDGQFGDNLTFGGLLVYDVTLNKGFHRLGGVNHGTSGQRCSNWWSQASSGVKRSLFIDDLVFSIAEDRMKVQKIRELGKDVADIRLM